MTWVRWGANKFVKWLARFAGDNMYDKSAVPDADWYRAQVGTAIAVAKQTTELLIDMIKPAFPKDMCSSNIGAMPKRSTVFLNTEDLFLYRPAGMSNKVVRVALAQSYLKDHAGKMFYDFKNNSKLRDEDEYLRLVQAERIMLRSLLSTRLGVAAAVTDEEVPALAGPVVTPAPAAAPAVSAAEEAPAPPLVAPAIAAPPAVPVVDASCLDEIEDVFGHGGGMDGDADDDVFTVVAHGGGSSSAASAAKKPKLFTFGRKPESLTIDLDSD